MEFGHISDKINIPRRKKMKKLTFLALLAICTSCFAIDMPDYDIGDDLHGGSHIDLDEGFDGPLL